MFVYWFELVVFDELFMGFDCCYVGVVIDLLCYCVSGMSVVMICYFEEELSVVDDFVWVCDGGVCY